MNEDASKIEGLSNAELRQQVELYQALFRDMSVGWAFHEMVFDQDGRAVDYVFLKVNEAFERFTGLKGEDIIGRGVAQIIPGIEDAEPDLITLYGEVVKTGQRAEFELYFEPFDKWYQVAASRTMPGHFAAMFDDITDRKRAELQLQQSEQRYRMLFEESPIALWEEDGSGLVALFNELRAAGVDDLRAHFESHPEAVAEAARRIRVVDVNEETLRLHHAQTKEELLAGLPKIFGPEALEVFQREVAALAEGRCRFESEAVVKTLDGEDVHIALRLAAAPGHEDDLSRVIVSNEDITERKRAEQKLTETMAALARSNEELQQFAYVASHDLQEPLRMVASYTELLSKRYEGQLDEKADKFIFYAVDGAKRMQRLINDLLAYSRVGTRARPSKATALNEVFDSLVAGIQLTIEEAGAEVTRDDLPAVLADETQLRQLLQNLVSNGLKFRRQEQARVHVAARRDGDQWVLSVADNGIGIEPEYQGRIFGIFQRLHERGQYPGSGIGLAIAKKIVERFHGRIWIESVSGEGTTFFFTLPAVEQA